MAKAGSWSTDTEKPTWLLYWNPGNDPANVRCRIAFDSWFYCHSPSNQGRAMYREGEFDTCVEQLDDMTLCLRVMATNSTNPGKAKEMLHAAKVHPHQDRLEEPHIWSFRREPPPQFTRPVYMLLNPSHAYI